MSATDRCPAAALRLGTQELVRRGFTAADMPEIGAAIARIVVDGEPPAAVSPTAAALRQRLSGVS